MMEWIGVRDRQPAVGQRCIVWHPLDRAPVFAYWHAGGFVEHNRGNAYRVGFSGETWWMPEPAEPLPGLGRPAPIRGLSSDLVIIDDPLAHREIR